MTDSRAIAAFDGAAGRSSAPSPGAGARPSPPPVAVTGLHLIDFRNHRDRRLSLDARSVMVSGGNGVGKTSLLEAISLLSPGRGLRSAPSEAVARRGGSGGWAAIAELCENGGTTAVAVACPAPASPGERGRRFSIDGAPLGRGADLTSWLRPVWLTPAMDSLLSGAPGDRRRFVDYLTSLHDPGHRDRLAVFSRAMRERLRLLKVGGSPLWLDAVERETAENAVAVAASRRVFMRKLAACCDALRDERPDDALPTPTPRLEGRLENELDDAPAVDVEEAYRLRLERARPDDARFGRTGDGPHLSDLVVIDDVSGCEAKFGSSGEQKAILVGLILAVIRLLVEDRRRGRPILLLDEIAAHLDRRRLDALFAAVAALGVQFWASGVAPVCADALGDDVQYVHLDAEAETSRRPLRIVPLERAAPSSLREAGDAGRGERRPPRQNKTDRPPPCETPPYERQR